MVISLGFKEDYERRNAILKKTRKREKLTKEERFFLETTPAFNSFLGYPYYIQDIINIKNSSPIKLRVFLESLSYSNKISPVIYVPAQKGEINANFEVFDFKGVPKKSCNLKMLALEMSSNNNYVEIEYYSSISLLAVHYECYCYNNILNRVVLESSMCGKKNYAMLKEEVSENKVRYFCKSPTSDSFEAMIFSIEF